jgi:hypothetical protein
MTWSEQSGELEATTRHMNICRQKSNALEAIIQQ